MLVVMSRLLLSAMFLILFEIGEMGKGVGGGLQNGPSASFFPITSTDVEASP